MKARALECGRDDSAVALEPLRRARRLPPIGRAVLLAAAVVVTAACSSNGSAQQASQAAPEVRLVIHLPIEGMSCMSCVGRVTRALRAEPGVTDVEVSLESRSARVVYVEGRVTPERIAAVVTALGYTVGAPVVP